MNVYECALSGLEDKGRFFSEEDDLQDLPAEWTEVRLSRRTYNPQWIQLQQTKMGLVQGILASVPEEQREMQAVAVKLQIDAQFYSMEQDIPVFLTEVEIVHLAPHQLSAEVHEAYNEVREGLGLAAIPVPKAEEPKTPALAETAEEEPPAEEVGA